MEAKKEMKIINLMTMSEDIIEGILNKYKFAHLDRVYELEIIDKVLSSLNYNEKTKEENIYEKFDTAFKVAIKKVLKNANEEDFDLMFKSYQEHNKKLDKLTIVFNFAEFLRSDINKQDEIKLVSKAKKKDKQARNKIIENYLDIIKYFAKINDDGRHFSDLSQDGIIYLIDAIKEYDLNKETDFFTYVCQNINNKMIERNKKDYTNQNVESMQTIHREELTRNKKRNNNFSSTDEKASPYEYCYNLALQAATTDILNELINLEQRILELRFGLNGEISHSAEEIAKILGETRERVNEIEIEALNRLKNSSKLNKIK